MVDKHTIRRQPQKYQISSWYSLTHRPLNKFNKLSQQEVYLLILVLRNWTNYLSLLTKFTRYRYSANILKLTFLELHIVYRKTLILLDSFYVFLFYFYCYLCMFWYFVLIAPLSMFLWNWRFYKCFSSNDNNNNNNSGLITVYPYYYRKCSQQSNHYWY